MWGLSSSSLVLSHFFCNSDTLLILKVGCDEVFTSCNFLGFFSYSLMFAMRLRVLSMVFSVWLATLGRNFQ
jgi:hypothetical protein